MTYEEYEYLDKRVKSARMYINRLKEIEEQINSIEISNVAINKIYLSDRNGNCLSLIDGQVLSTELIDDIRNKVLESLKMEKEKTRGRFEGV